ncbi:MAG: ABC transporter substrate-binding protein [Deltaproteobacteria bacterium]|jgi:NitT/TauT family transport system substrate-binding protein|nr:ABC transporter substrate-binding protein [Deltaproteobacteria bacterium]
MKFKTLLLTLPALLLVCLSSPAKAETFTVFYNPYDTTSFQAIISDELKLWKKYVPENVIMDFKAAPDDETISRAMLKGIGAVAFMGLTHATLMNDNPNGVKLKFVASLGMSEGKRCNSLLAKNANSKVQRLGDMTSWISDVTVATPAGSDSDLYLRRLFSEHNVRPKDYVILSNADFLGDLKDSMYDLVSVCEPVASSLKEQSAYRYIVDNDQYKSFDLGVLVMRTDFYENNQEVAKALIRGELEAQRFMLDPANHQRVIKLIANRLEDYDPAVLWQAIYGRVPEGEDDIREWKSFYFGDKEREAIESTTPFLYSERLISASRLAEGVIDDSIARVVYVEDVAPIEQDSVLGFIRGNKKANPFRSNIRAIQ